MLCVASLFVQLPWSGAINVFRNPDFTTGKNFVQANPDQVDNKDMVIEEKLNNPVGTTSSGNPVISFTEQELISYIYSNSEGEVAADALQLDVENGTMSIFVDLSKTNLSNTLETPAYNQLPIPANLLQNLAVIVDLSASEDGKTIMVDSINVNSPFGDVLGEQFRSFLGEPIPVNSLTLPVGDYSVESIRFLNDRVELGLIPASNVDQFGSDGEME
jgi:hypothetical protein